MTVLNGLDVLDQEREAKRAQRRPARYVPPPKRTAAAHTETSPPADDAATPKTDSHPVSDETAAASAEAVIDLREVDAAETPGEAPQAAVQHRKPEPRPKTARKAQPASAAPKGAKDDGRVTAYLDRRHIDFLDDIRFSPARRRLRVDVSGSAVVRFALERLADEMKPEEVYEAIAAKPVDDQAVGRKRR